MPFIRSISGLRATIGDCLTPQIVADYCSALSAILPPGSIIIGRDGRPSGKWIENVVLGTLTACGRQVINLGVVPTPTVQLLVEKNENAVAGIVITASHNPGQWNGMKFINSFGVFFNADENEILWKSADSCNFEFSSSQRLFDYIGKSDAIDFHIEQVLNLKIFSDSDLFEKISERNFKIVVDAVNSSGSVAIPSLLAKLKCGMVPLYCDSSGVFPHTPEPLPQNLTELSNLVKIDNADMGIAVDPDADRLVLIDENGEPIGEEKTITLAVQSVFSNWRLFSGTYNKIAVVNHSTTQMVDDIAAQYDAKVLRSPVGEINVVNMMKKSGAVIGGEGSGGVILPECHYGRDSIVGTALILALMAQTGKKLSELSKALPKYEMVKYKKEFSGVLMDVIPKIEQLFPNGKLINEDGIKIYTEGGWVQLRRSNTEPIVRIISEAKNLTQANELINMIIPKLK